jgi:hypothetical protein
MKKLWRAVDGNGDIFLHRQDKEPQINEQLSKLLKYKTYCNPTDYHMYIGKKETMSSSYNEKPVEVEIVERVRIKRSNSNAKFSNSTISF